MAIDVGPLNNNSNRPLVSTTVETNRTMQPASEADNVVPLSARPVNAVVAAEATDVTDSETQQAEVAPEQLEEAVASVNEFVQSFSRSLQFNIDDNSGDTVVRVVDQETNDVVRQIPSEEILAISQRIQDLNEQLSDTTGVILSTQV